MAKLLLREAARKEWNTGGESASLDQIQVGALQLIADHLGAQKDALATLVRMATSQAHTVRYWHRRCLRAEADVRRLEKQVKRRARR